MSRTHGVIALLMPVALLFSLFAAHGMGWLPPKDNSSRLAIPTISTAPTVFAGGATTTVPFLMMDNSTTIATIDSDGRVTCAKPLRTKEEVNKMLGDAYGPIYLALCNPPSSKAVEGVLQPRN